jgi:hypothetical protein
LKLGTHLFSGTVHPLVFSNKFAPNLVTGSSNLGLEKNRLALFHLSGLSAVRLHGEQNEQGVCEFETVDSPMKQNIRAAVRGWLMDDVL